jgi:NADH:ubiquinone oxidoreductase subunit 5 (subunit L)/multisubunit Na+/H+ antiporter MnhA subunit
LVGAVTGLVVGAITMTGVMLLWNYLITPLYMEATREQIVAMLPTVFLPFNLLKAGLNAAFTFLLYRPVITGLRKAGLVESTGSGKAKRIPWGLVLVAVMIIITCVLFILSLNGII